MRSALRAFGPIVAGPEVEPADWLAVLEGRSPLALSPDSAAGWFGGTTLVAYDPDETGSAPGSGSGSLAAAGEVLTRALDAAEPVLAVAQLPYTGDCRWALYRRGFVRCADGWRAWGDADSVPAVPLVPALAAAEHAGRRDDGARGGGSVTAPGALVTDAATDLDQAAFVSAVEATREAILAGDVYVLNLTRRISATTSRAPHELWRAMDKTAPASMSATWVAQDGSAIVSASPERFVRLVGHEVEIAPVKGTRPRGRDSGADAEIAAELAACTKERAEHVMIVDLERNDLGRVCESGSVRVEPLFALESTAYCHQMVSSVRGLMRADATVSDLLEATFPCGSVTGAPKVAAMEHIDRLEGSPRGAYTGSLVVAVPGELDSSVLIRTAELGPVQQPAGTRVVRYGTGCGITVESDALAEWDESVLKTAPLLGRVPPRALRETCRVASGTVPLWRWHRERLAAGGCGEALLERADREVAHAAAGWEDVATKRARLTLSVTPEGELTVEVAQRLSSLDVPNGPLAARVAAADSPPLPPGPAKPYDRSWWDGAHRIAEAAGAHQAVIVDPDGLVVDGSTSCVWIVEGGCIIAPPAPPAIPSVSAAFIAQRAAAIGLEVRREPVSWERFEAADEAFLSNAFGGAVAIRGRGGAVFAQVRAFFDDVWG
ncbi:MAG: hypothetical protein HGB10_06825 [Coriobacteriia bacterium]|nr:hypothetical protein [Coriobacteriia bacterium]